MSHHHNQNHKHNSKKFRSLGEYHVKDNRSNVLGYVFSLAPWGQVSQTVDAGGCHYAC